MSRLSPRHGRRNGLLTLILCAGLAAAPVLAQTQPVAPASSQPAAKSSTKPAAGKPATKKPAANARPAAQAPARTSAQPVAAASAQAAPTPQGAQFADGIAAVVDKDVITLREVRESAQRAAAELRQRNIQVPPEDVLQRQVLQQLIMDRVVRQEAERQGIRVDDSTVEQAIQVIATRNKLTPAQLRAEIEKTGTSWDDYLKTLRDDIRMDRLRQRAIDSTIVVSDAEVDAFLKDQANGGRTFGQAGAAPAPAAGPVALAQILVRVPEGASPDTVANLRKKAEALLARARKGEDFASLAAANSDGPEALKGGQMGARPLDGWPDLFVQAISSLQAGQISELIQSGNGFHILKVLSRAGGSQAPAPAAPGQAAGLGAGAAQAPVRVVQTHARHILIKVSAVMNEQQARERIDMVRQRIVLGGEKFEDMARQYSQDSNAPQGGDLGWLNPGETVPAFETAMNALQPGQISEPVLSPFGWHLIQVIERREQDVSDEIRRNEARQFLFERRAKPAFEDWLETLRSQAYVDNRLEKQEALEQRYR